MCECDLLLQKHSLQNLLMERCWSSCVDEKSPECIRRSCQKIRPRCYLVRLSNDKKSIILYY